MILSIDLHGFIAATPARGAARGSKDVFATPFERQGSLIQLEPMHANSGASSSKPGQEAPQNGETIVYCPIGTPTAKSGSASQPQDQHRCVHQGLCNGCAVSVAILVPSTIIAHTHCVMTINACSILALAARNSSVFVKKGRAR